jgi:hypothetical protein
MQTDEPSRNDGAVTPACPVWPFPERHAWSPWVQERWRRSVDTRVCLCCKTAFEVRDHVSGTPMFLGTQLR